MQKKVPVFGSISASEKRKIDLIHWIMPIILMTMVMGCATVGHEFPTDRVSDIRIGQTTQNDIRAIFGPPWRVGIDDGLTTWTYGRYRYKVIGSANTTDMVIRFDNRGTVTSYTFNTTEDPNTVSGSKQKKSK